MNHTELQDALQASAQRHRCNPDLTQNRLEHAESTLLQLCQCLPARVLADMVAYTIAADEEGESESTSDFLYEVGKLRFGDDWQANIENAKARYDTGYLS